MKVHLKHPLEKDIESVRKFYTDKKVIKAKLEALGSRNVKVKVKAKDEDHQKVKITREDSAEIPGIFKNFIKPWNKITQTEVWKKKKKGNYKCDIKLVTDILPIRVEGKTLLKHKKKQWIIECICEVYCDIPLIGKKLAEFVAVEIEKGIRKEIDYITENA